MNWNLSEETLEALRGAEKARRLPTALRSTAPLLDGEAI
jgi:hypothetical protein